MAKSTSEPATSGGPRPPADPSELEPVSRTLAAKSVLFRVHPTFLRATAFNPRFGLGARFHFIRTSDGSRVPALYAAATAEAAIAETVFHDVPLRPKEGRRLSARKLEDRALTPLETRQELELIELHHPGLGRLGLEPEEITATDPSHYPRTRAWAQALHHHGDDHGLVWMSRLFNVDRVYTFFGDRVAEAAFSPAAGSLPLWRGRGLDWIHQLAESLGIDVIHD